MKMMWYLSVAPEMWNRNVEGNEDIYTRWCGIREQKEANFNVFRERICTF